MKAAYLDTLLEVGASVYVLEDAEIDVKVCSSGVSICTVVPVKQVN
jgi:hypothetical protein